MTEIEDGIPEHAAGEKRADEDVAEEAAEQATVRVIFLRHGPAVARDAWSGPEFDRPLTEKGRRRTREGLKRLRAIVGRPDVVLTSPLTRCRQTAELAASAWRCEPPRGEDALAPGGDPGQLAKILEAHAAARSLVLVGHHPDLERWIAATTCGHPQPFLELRKGGACCVDVPIDGGAPSVRWVVTPRLLRDL